ILSDALLTATPLTTEIFTLSLHDALPIYQNLPAFVTMYDTLGRGLPKGHAQNWGAGFLPSVYQGTALNAQGEPINNMVRPKELRSEEHTSELQSLRHLVCRLLLEKKKH